VAIYFKLVDILNVSHAILGLGYHYVNTRDYDVFPKCTNLLSV